MAEQDFYDYNYEFVDVSFTSGASGNYTANYANLSSVPRNSEDWLGFGDGIYVGAFESESLFEFDYSPRPWAATPAVTNYTDLPYTLRNYEAAFGLLADENTYLSVSSVIEFSSSDIIGGGSHVWVRVPVPLSSIAVHEGAGVFTLCSFVQVTHLGNGRVYFFPIDDDRWTESGFYGCDSTAVDGRLYVELRCPIVPETQYRFDFFCPLQGLAPDYEDDPREENVLSPRVYFTGEDIFQPGQTATISAGVLGYHLGSAEFYIYEDYAGVGGFSYDVGIDAGWSFLFVEGMSNDLFGVEVEVERGDVLEFRPTIVPASNNSHASFYLPFICDDEIDYNITMWAPSGSAWYLSNGSAADVTSYWTNNEDCDGDGYLDYENLSARDFFYVSSRTMVSNYSYIKSSEWRFQIEFSGDYTITFLCQYDYDLILIDDESNPYLTNCWLIVSCAEYDLYNSLLFDYCFLSDGLFAERYFNATGHITYSYPHFYRYALAFVYGSKTVWLEVNESVYFNTVNGLVIWDGEVSEEGIEASFLDAIYDDLQGAWGIIGTLAGQMWDGINWLGAMLNEIGHWIYNGMVSFVETLKLIVEAVVNFLSFVVEFGVIIISLVVFFGAIVLYNKVLMIVRDAMYKMLNGLNKTYKMIGGTD